jgi:hypothetical protein
MTTDYRAELQRLVKAYDDHGGKWPENDVEALHQAVERARSYLSQPVPEEPTDEELHTMLYYEFTTSTGHGERSDPIGFARAVLARWGK